MPNKAATRFRLRGPRARWFGHPLIILAIIAYLGIDFLSIPAGSWHGPSTVKQTAIRATSSLLRRARPTGPRVQHSPAHFLTRGDDVTLVWITAASRLLGQGNAEYNALLQDGWSFAGQVSPRVDVRSGFYHITRRTTSFHFTAENERMRQRCMAVFVDEYNKLPHTDGIRYSNQALDTARNLYAQGKWDRVTHLPLGYLRNTIALTLLLLLAFLPLKGRTDLWLKAWYKRMFKRQKPGHCLQCGYDATGLTQCPECGAPTPNEKPAAT